MGDVPNEKPVWGATHIKDLQIQIFDKNTTLYELDCPHIRQLPAAPILPRGFSLNDASHDLTKGCCATCENKWLDPQDEEDEDKLGTLLKQQFVAEHKQNSDSFRVHAENWVCLFCGGIFCGYVSSLLARRSSASPHTLSVNRLPVGRFPDVPQYSLPLIS